MQSNKPFEDFLENKCWEINPQVLDDDMPDFLDDWLGQLDPQEYIDYGNEAMSQNAAKILGSITSKKKKDSSRKNGKKGGRPKNKINEEKTL